MGLIHAPSIKSPLNDSVELFKMNQVVCWKKLTPKQQSKLRQKALETIYEWGNDD